ncbi:MAG: GNAT family N-acetyltransferase [Candidatus Bathyarchaeota archaeon]|nr:GNAT family N-acetyltransferase [Candidatus Bathyarchaeota archaeon]
MLEIKEQWNKLVHSKSQNPYCLYGFIEQFFASAIKSDEKPLIIVGFCGEKIVGIAPLAICSRMGIFRVAGFLTGRDFDPDFIVEEEYRDVFLHKIVDFIFKEAGCNLIDFSMPSETESLKVLKRTSTELGTYYLPTPAEGHSVLPVEGTWSEFEKRRGKNFRKFFKSIGRKMELLGPWKILSSTGNNSPVAVYKDILEIEQSSWKQNYRAQKGLENDEGLLALLTGAANTSREPGFSWQVDFLEIEGKKIAYLFWFEYKGTVFLCKTSFNNEYRKLSPGVYINNVVVREAFSSTSAKQIDFMTNLQFHFRWNPKIVSRTRIIISKSPIPVAILKASQSWYVLPIRRKIGRITNRILSFSFL